MKINYIILFILLAVVVSCQSVISEANLKEGVWLGAIMVDEHNSKNVAPFNMEIFTVEGDYKIVITNDSEKIEITEVEIIGDSITIYLPVFQNKLVGRIIGNSIVGDYIKPTYSMPFYAIYGVAERFPDMNKDPEFDVSGRWKIIENQGMETENIMVGEFTQNDNKLSGTFLTVLGDYRYLEGSVSGNQLMLSCFDGAHSLLFKAIIDSEDSMTNGIFRGSPSWKSEWIAIRDDQIELPDPGNLTYIKDGYEKLEFSFKDMEGNYVGLGDERFQDKVVIVQILGTWCPNCMDETKFFASLYNKYRDQGLEIIGLCFELDDYEQSLEAIRRFKDHNNADYTFLYAGPADKTEAAKVLPMLNKIISYPTAIFISKNKEVRKIHTGFSGPGTGVYYDELSKSLIKTVEELLKE